MPKSGTLTKAQIVEAVTEANAYTRNKSFDLGINAYKLFLIFPIPPDLKRSSISRIESDFQSDSCAP